MKRLGFGALLSFLLVGSLAAQNGSKRVDLKEITDGQFRQVTNIGEMRSMPDGEHYTAMNDARNMIIKYSYGAIRNRFIAVHSRRMCMTTMCAVIM